MAAHCATSEQTIEMLKTVGWLGPAPGVLFVADPRALPSDRLPGEGPEGLVIREHPEAMLLADPILWGPVEEYRAGVRSEPALAEWAGCSAFAVSVWTELRGAERRKEKKKWSESPHR